MPLHSFHALPESRRKLWKSVRLFVPRRMRWFYEGCMAVPGQLWYADRRMLYEAIRRVKPDTVFEVGTWRGGGSTYFISQALYENGGGVLHTIECDPGLHAEAKALYKEHLPHLLPHVEFHCGTSEEVYPGILEQLGAIDAVFLDGGNNSARTLAELRMFSAYIRADGIVLAHDWDNEKMALVRPFLENSADWRLTDHLTAPRSVGFAVWVRER